MASADGVIGKSDKLVWPTKLVATTSARVSDEPDQVPHP